MKTSEKLIAVEDYLSVKGVALEDFYSIRIDDAIRLQGKFDSKFIHSLRKSHSCEFNECGNVEITIRVPAENQEIIPVTIVLT